MSADSHAVRVRDIAIGEKYLIFSQLSGLEGKPEPITCITIAFNNATGGVTLQATQPLGRFWQCNLARNPVASTIRISAADIESVLLSEGLSLESPLYYLNSGWKGLQLKAWMRRLQSQTAPEGASQSAQPRQETGMTCSGRSDITMEGMTEDIQGAGLSPVASSQFVEDMAGLNMERSMESGDHGNEL